MSNLRFVTNKQSLLQLGILLQIFKRGQSWKNQLKYILNSSPLRSNVKINKCRTIFGTISSSLLLRPEKSYVKIKQSFQTSRYICSLLLRAIKACVRAINLRSSLKYDAGKADQILGSKIIQFRCIGTQFNYILWQKSS